MVKQETAPVTKPFLKWAGGKFKVVPDLKKKFPNTTKRYFEPFLGAGSVALNVDYPICIVSDTNADLMLVWEMLKEMGMDFVSECEALFKTSTNKRKCYDEFREEFNTTKDKLRKATLFIYLNRHCFNGLCRYNGSGEFNVPFGKYDKPYFPREEFEKCLEKVKTFQLHTKDFREMFEMVEEDDLVYCDPPYLPMSESANFDSYSVGGFDLRDQIELAECAEKAAEKGATVVISNHYNWYSRQIYTDLYGGKISKIQVSRTISSKTDKRDAVDEIVAVFKSNKVVAQPA
jgi:DNA adenine methylase